MADRYWTYPRGVEASFHNTAYWSATLLGSGGESVPTTGDVAHFHGTAYNGVASGCLISQAVLCSIDTSAQYDNTYFTVAAGGSVSLSANLTGFASITLSGGSLDSNDYNISAFKSINFMSGTAVLGTSTLTLTDDLYSGSDNVFSLGSCSVDLSATTIICEGLALLSAPDGGTFGTVTITSSEMDISGDITVNNLSLLGDGTVRFRNTTADQTITVLDALVIEGDTSGGKTLYAEGTEYDVIFNKASGIVTVQNCTLADLSASGGATFLALSSYGCVDDGGNTGWVTLARFYVTHEDYNFHDIDNWSLTSGGSGGASVPTTGYTAIFDANSPSLCYITGAVYCSITSIKDEMTLFVQTGGILSLYKDLTIDCISISETGSFVTNNYNITAHFLDFTDTPSVSLGTSIITFMSDDSSCYGFYVRLGTTIDADEAIINLYSGASGAYFESYENTFGALNIILSSSDHTIDVFGSNTFGDLSITGDGTVSFNAEEDVPTTQTVTGTLTLEGDTEEGLVLDEYLYDYWEISMASGTVNASNCFFYRSVATGGATFNALTTNGNVDGGGNTGWDFGESGLNVTVSDGLSFAETQEALLSIQEEADDNLDLVEYYQSLIWTSGSNSIYDEEMADYLSLYDTQSLLYTFDGPVSEILDLADSQLITWLQSIDDGLDLTDTVIFGWLKSLVETLFAYEELKTGWGVTNTESLVLADAAAGILGLLIADWLTLKDSQGNNWNGKEIVPDTLNLFDIAANSQRYTRTVNEALAIADTNSYALLLTILDSLRFTDLSTAIRNISEAATDVLNIGDIPYNTYLQTISEALSLIDAFTVLRAAIGTVTESLALADTVQPKNYMSRSISESLVFSETLAVKGAVYNVVYDTLRMNLAVELSGEVYECYVLNTPKFLPSMYSGFDFNSYAVFENRAFGANSTGIYELTGETDAGANISTGVIMSQTDFGSPNQKRFRRGYVGISGTNPVMVLETEDGSREAYAIDTNGKFVASHDLKGKKWKLSVADFDELDCIKLIPVILTK